MFPEGGSHRCGFSFWGGVSNFFFWVTPTEFKTTYRNPQLKPFSSKSGKREGLWTCPQVRGTRAYWVQAAG
jgi:hypothetical protein